MVWFYLVLVTLMLIYCNYSELFHPDNIKNYHNGNDGGKVSIALHKLWAEFGGTSGLASGLKSDTKVNASTTIISLNLYI